MGACLPNLRITFRPDIHLLRHITYFPSPWIDYLSIYWCNGTFTTVGAVASLQARAPAHISRPVVQY